MIIEQIIVFAKESLKNHYMYKHILVYNHIITYSKAKVKAMGWALGEFMGTCVISPRKFQGVICKNEAPPDPPAPGRVQPSIH